MRVSNPVLVTIVAFMLQLGALATSAFAHPAETLPANEVDQAYGDPNYGTPAEYSFGDVTFNTPYPAASTLSNIERYMLEGTSSSAEGYGRTAWWKDVMAHVTAYYSRHASIPPTLDIEMVKTVAWQPNSVNAGVMAWLRNPITDQVAKLTSAEFSSGDLFIKVLSESEINELCEKDVLMDNALRRHVRVNPATGEETPIELLTPPFYVRMYGENSVIMSRIYFEFRSQD